MKVKKNGFDTFVYICLALLSFGMIPMMRVVISVAIREALTD